MKWSLDVHKYISEITRKALQIVAAHGITSQSSDEAIDAVERELASANVYKDYDGAKGRVRRALFTYFKAFGCLNDSEQLTEVGKAFSDNKLSIQEFCFYFIVNYKYRDNNVSYYPLELILKFLKAISSDSLENAYITPYDFSKLVECNSIDEVNDEFISESIEARQNSPISVEERKIGYDVWSKMLINAGILEKSTDRSLRVKNINLVEWILSAYEKNIPSVKGKLVTGIICDLPVFPYGRCSEWENYKEEGAALQAFLFEGVDNSIIEKYIKKTQDISFGTLITKVGLSYNNCGFYKDFVGLDKLVAYRLQNHESDSPKVVGSILLTSDIVYNTVEEAETVKGGMNTLLYGVPGSGKSWTIEHEYCKKGSNVERLVFHPDYTYSDFIGQILPDVSEDGQVSYRFTPGPFTTILRDAYENPQREYILIIEEINRGNAPAIFGEVFQLLDRKVEIKEDDDGYPIGTSEYGITNKNIALVVYGDERQKVRIPSNLSIIGTMNTSDQNVFTLDTAFQRRWDMRLIENNFDNVDTTLADAEILDTGVTWRAFCESINEIIIGNNARMTSSEDKRLGAYFVHLRDLKFDSRANEEYDGEYDALYKKEKAGTLNEQEKNRLLNIRDALKQNRKFPEKVIKYLWDDAFKFSREVVFESSEYQSLEAIIRKFIKAKGFDRFAMFKQNVRDTFESKKQQ